MARLSVKIKGERDVVLRKARYIVSQALMDTLEHAQRTQPSISRTGTFEVGKIPVLTGELVNSSAVGGAMGADAYAAPIAGYQLGQELAFRWTALHAAPIEYGFTTVSGKHVPGRFYVTTAVGKFLEFAAARAKEV